MVDVIFEWTRFFLRFDETHIKIIDEQARLDTYVLLSEPSQLLAR